MNGKDVSVLIWLITTEIFTVLCADEHTSFFSVATVIFLTIYVVAVIMEMMENEREDRDKA